MKEVRIRLVLFFILFGSFAAVHWKEVAAIGTVINQLPALLRPAKIESIKVPVIWENIPEINLSTRLVGGFETAYKYTI